MVNIGAWKSIAASIVILPTPPHVSGTVPLSLFCFLLTQWPTLSLEWHTFRHRTLWATHSHTRFNLGHLGIIFNIYINSLNAEDISRPQQINTMPLSWYPQSTAPST